MPRAPFHHLTTSVMSVACVLSLAGCSGGRFETAEVKGTVTVDGKPAAGLMMEFAPARRDDVQPPLSFGLTDANGTYTARGRKGDPGVVVGMIRVTFSVNEGAPPIAPGRSFGEEILDREVKSGSNTIDFPLESKPRKP